MLTIFTLHYIYIYIYIYIYRTNQRARGTFQIDFLVVVDLKGITKIEKITTVWSTSRTKLLTIDYTFVFPAGSRTYLQLKLVFSEHINKLTHINLNYVNCH